MSDRETALRRVQKLLALATSPNEHEASSAAEKAQELMQRWKIEEAEVRPGGDSVTVESWIYANTTVTWRRDLAYAVARGFFCRCVHVPRCKESQNKAWLNFVGKKEDIAIAKSVYEWLSKELQRLAKESVKAERKRLKAMYIAVGLSSRLKNWHHSFLLGAVGRLSERLREGEDRFKEEEAGRALVVASSAELDESLSKLFADLEPAPPAADAKDMRAWSAGDAVGNRVAIQPPAEIGGGGGT